MHVCLVPKPVEAGWNEEMLFQIGVEIERKKRARRG